MVDAQNPIPFTQPGDSDDVELALETAQRLHRTGDYIEALKWLRRAVNSADEAGDDRRQLELARAAADYTAFAAAPTSVASPGPVETAGSTAPTKATSENHLPVSHSPSRMPPQAPKPPPPPSARISVAPAVVAAPAVPEQTADVLSVKPATSGGPPPMKPRSASVSPGPQSSTAPGKQKISDSQIPPAPKAVSVASLTPQPNAVGPSRAPAPAVEVVSPKTQTLGPPSGFHDVSSPPKGAQRVAVRVSARDENLYIVRPLSPGQRVPVGTREAWLFFGEASNAERTPVKPSRGS